MKSKKLKIKHFISESISVLFSTPPNFIKKPTCPDSFNWQGRSYNVVKCLSEWTDFTRRGRMSNNMQPQHAEVASQRGSWGVGKFYFDVLTQDKQTFRLYYDRAPKNAYDREGKWILLAELSDENE
ncbi:MAG: DUF6504 family protein [Chloroflexota bacterium]|nr:DUF6504 family protein [Chloroflexota bacterium]